MPFTISQVGNQRTKASKDFHEASSFAILFDASQRPLHLSAFAI